MRTPALVVAAGLALAGCTLEPHYVRPSPAIPGAFPTGGTYPAATQALPSVSYRDVFRDPHLQAIIERAIAGNQDLAIAMANVSIARAQYKVERAQLLPRLNLTAGETETHGKVTTITPSGVGSSRETSRSYAADIGLSAFEIDLFGRVRSLTKAAQQQYFASAAGVRQARLTLVAEVADAYLSLAADRSLLAIA